MRILLALLLVFQSFSSFAWEQPTLYMQPGRPGHFSSTPPPSPGSPGGRADYPNFSIAPAPRGGSSGGHAPQPMDAPSRSNPVSQAPVRPAPSMGPAPKSRPSEESYSAHDANRGFMLAADIAGGAALGQSIENAKAAKAYAAWVESTTVVLAPHFAKLPRKGKDLPAGAQPPTVDQVLEGDAAEAEELARSGEGLILQEFMSRGQVIQLMRSYGLDVSTGSNDEADVFLDVYNRFYSQERAFLDGLVRDGRASSVKMRQEAGRNVEALENAIAQMENESAKLNGRPLASPAPEPNMMSPEVYGEFRDVEQRVGRIEGFAPQEASLKELALRAIAEGKQAIRDGLGEQGMYYFRIARTLADLAVGIDPITGFGRSAIEALTGYNAITFEKLSGVERGFAVFGVLTAGTIQQAKQVIRIVGKLGGKVRTAERIIEKAEKTGQQIPKLWAAMRKAYESSRNFITRGNRSKYLEDIDRALFRHFDDYEIVNIHSAEELNEMYLMSRPKHERPFQAWTFGLELKVKNSEEYLHFSESATYEPNRSGRIGAWLVRKKDVSAIRNSGKTAGEVAGDIKAYASLPNRPSFVTNVEVHSGTTLYMGRAAEQFGGAEGGTQYLLKDKLDERNYGATRSIGDWLNEK